MLGCNEYVVESQNEMHYIVNRSWFVWYLEKEMGLASISVKILLYWIQILVQVHKKKTRFKKKKMYHSLLSMLCTEHWLQHKPTKGFWFIMKF